MRIFPDAAALLGHARENGLAEGFEVEEFIKGEVCPVDGVIRDGEVVFVHLAKYLHAPIEAMHDGVPHGSVTVGAMRPHAISNPRARFWSGSPGTSAARYLGRFASEHVGLCLDACHLAVAHEPPRAALGTLAGAGVEVVKLHASAALTAADPRSSETAAALAGYAEPRFLHQTREPSAPGMRGTDDLAGALAACPATNPGASTSTSRCISGSRRRARGSDRIRRRRAGPDSALTGLGLKGIPIDKRKGSGLPHRAPAARRAARQAGHLPAVQLPSPDRGHRLVRVDHQRGALGLPQEIPRSGPSLHTAS